MWLSPVPDDVLDEQQNFHRQVVVISQLCANQGSKIISEIFKTKFSFQIWFYMNRDPKIRIRTWWARRSSWVWRSIRWFSAPNCSKRFAANFVWRRKSPVLAFWWSFGWAVSGCPGKGKDPRSSLPSTGHIPIPLQLPEV